MNTTTDTTNTIDAAPYYRRGYLMTLQAIGDGLQAIGKLLDADQSRVIAHVLAQRYVQEGEIDRQIATLDAHRRERLERRLQVDRRVADVPVEVERRQGERRSGGDRRDVRNLIAGADIQASRIEVEVAGSGWHDDGIVDRA